MKKKKKYKCANCKRKFPRNYLIKSKVGLVCGRCLNFLGLKKKITKKSKNDIQNIDIKFKFRRLKNAKEKKQKESKKAKLFQSKRKEKYFVC